MDWCIPYKTDPRNFSKLLLRLGRRAKRKEQSA
jgi:hypothetical protein